MTVGVEPIFPCILRSFAIELSELASENVFGLSPNFRCVQISLLIHNGLQPSYVPQFVEAGDDIVNEVGPSTSGAIDDLVLFSLLGFVVLLFFGISFTV